MRPQLGAYIQGDFVAHISGSVRATSLVYLLHSKSGPWTFVSLSHSTSGCGLYDKESADDFLPGRR